MFNVSFLSGSLGLYDRTITEVCKKDLEFSRKLDEYNQLMDDILLVDFQGSPLSKEERCAMKSKLERLESELNNKICNNWLSGLLLVIKNNFFGQLK